MNPTERGKENLETLEDRKGERGEQASGAGTERVRNGEVAGGDRDDVPGGAYNVRKSMAEEVSDDPARQPRKER